MQTIETKHIGPTDHRGARIKATASNGDAVTIPYPYDLSDTDKHIAAVRKLAAKLNWTGEMIAGWTARGMVWVFADKSSPRITLGEASESGELDAAYATAEQSMRGAAKLVARPGDKHEHKALSTLLWASEDLQAAIHAAISE